MEKDKIEKNKTPSGSATDEVLASPVSLGRETIKTIADEVLASPAGFENETIHKLKVDFCKDGEFRERKYVENAFKNARVLRKKENTTEAEKLMWYYLKDRKMGDLKFRRQVAIGNYIVDFVCIEKKLIIELDGGQHNEEKNIEYDKERSVYLRGLGYEVMRFWNNDVFKNMNGVLQTIYETVK